MAGPEGSTQSAAPSLELVFSMKNEEFVIWNSPFQLGTISTTSQSDRINGKKKGFCKQTAVFLYFLQRFSGLQRKSHGLYISVVGMWELSSWSRFNRKMAENKGFCLEEMKKENVDLVCVFFPGFWKCSRFSFSLFPAASRNGTGHTLSSRFVRKYFCFWRLCFRQYIQCICAVAFICWFPDSACCKQLALAFCNLCLCFFFCSFGFTLFLAFRVKFSSFVCRSSQKLCSWIQCFKVLILWPSKLFSLLLFPMLLFFSCFVSYSFHEIYQGPCLLENGNLSINFSF